jgi:hypothetical protein
LSHAAKWVWLSCIEMDAVAKQFLEEHSSMLKCQERTPALTK